MSTLSFPKIGLNRAQLRAAARRAKEKGKTPSEYLRALVERDLLAGRSFDEVLRPFQSAFATGGMSEAELDGIVAAARRDLVSDRRKVRR
jgi:hypothetical protein